MGSRFRGPINRLRALGKAWAEIFEVQGTSASVVRAFAATRDPLDLPHLLPLALSPDRQMAEAAAATIHSCLSRCAPGELLELDVVLRGAYRWSAESPWQRVVPESLEMLGAAGEHAAVLGLASFHPSGYVREAAVRALAGIRTGAELPFLLIRVNDWVSAVQDVAHRAVAARLVPDYAVHLVAALRLVVRLERCARADHAALLKQAEALLQRPESRAALVEGSRAPDIWLRRRCYRLLFAAEGVALPGIVHQALVDEDSVIRLWGAERAESAFDLPGLDAALARMARDAFMPVRREALRIRVRHFPTDAPRSVREALLDRHATIRQIARFYAREKGTPDVREFYRSALAAATSPPLRAAIYGVGETGRAEDAALIEPYVLHSLSGVRKAAVTALARIAAARSAPLFMRALADVNAGVSRAARQALASPAVPVRGEQIWEIFERSSEVHVRINALSLLARLGKWEGIGWVIRARTVEDEQVRRAARQYVQRWIERFNRSHSRPTADQLARMAQALDVSAPSHPEKETERLLRFLMKGFDV